jgi:hypothetical protein
VLQIITIILGSGLVSGLVTHFLSTSAEEKKFRREKLEQLYLLAFKYCRETVDVGVAIRFKEPRAKIPKEDDFFEMAHMLTGLYFPKLETRLRAFEEEFSSFVMRKGPPTNEEELKLNEIAAAFVASIVIEARQLDKPWWPFRI